MMKSIVIFMLSFLVSSALFFAFIYVLGYLIEQLGISLYESEADQQRNFNVVIASWIVIAMLVSAFYTKYKLTKRCS